jgi:hypothetical protein
MAPRPLPRAINRLHGSREPKALAELPEPSLDLVEIADRTDLQTLRTAQKLLRQAMADVGSNGLFVTNPRGNRVCNPSVAVVSQQQRIILAITKAIRAPRRPETSGGLAVPSGKFIDGVPVDSQLGQYLLQKPDRIAPVEDDDPAAN